MFHNNATEQNKQQAIIADMYYQEAFDEQLS